MATPAEGRKSNFSINLRRVSAKPGKKVEKMLGNGHSAYWHFIELKSRRGRPI